MEGTFEELRKQGAPDQSSGAYKDVDTTGQLFQVCVGHSRTWTPQTSGTSGARMGWHISCIWGWSRMRRVQWVGAFDAGESLGYIAMYLPNEGSLAET